MKDKIDELKAAEKEALNEFESVEKPKGAAPPNSLRLGLGLILIGIVLLAIVFSGANGWNFWWLIFFVKPVLFGWSCGGRSEQTGSFACRPRADHRSS